jgi:hypothetical protein
VGHSAAAFCESPPVFCGCRGILTAYFLLYVVAVFESAISKSMRWRANVKEKSQATKA